MANYTTGAQRYNKRMDKIMEFYHNDRANKAKLNAPELLTALEGANFVIKQIASSYPQTDVLLSQDWIKEYLQKIETVLNKI